MTPGEGWAREHDINSTGGGRRASEHDINSTDMDGRAITRQEGDRSPILAIDWSLPEVYTTSAGPR